LILASLAVGIVLAVGAAFAASNLVSQAPPPVTKRLDNYGTP
jgi:hypothetical protein